MAITRKTFIDPPVLKKPLAFILFIVNIFFPGVGTIIVGLLTCRMKNFLVGVVQLLLAACIVGWVWSILWGWELLQAARRHPFTPLLDPVKEDTAI